MLRAPEVLNYMVRLERTKVWFEVEDREKEAKEPGVRVGEYVLV